MKFAFYVEVVWCLCSVWRAPCTVSPQQTQTQKSGFFAVSETWFLILGVLSAGASELQLFTPRMVAMLISGVAVCVSLD